MLASTGGRAGATVDPQAAAEFEAAPWLLPARTPSLPYAGQHDLDALLAQRAQRVAGALGEEQRTAVVLLLFSKAFAVMAQNSSERRRRRGRALQVPGARPQLRGPRARWPSFRRPAALPSPLLRPPALPRSLLPSQAWRRARLCGGHMDGRRPACLRRPQPAVRRRQRPAPRHAQPPGCGGLALLQACVPWAAACGGRRCPPALPKWAHPPPITIHLPNPRAGSGESSFGEAAFVAMSWLKPALLLRALRQGHAAGGHS